MHSLINGKLVPDEQAVVSVHDRGLLYGDGLFETLRVCRGQAFQLDLHLDRLSRGAEFLRINIPFSSRQLHEQVSTLIQANRAGEAVLRITLTRGVGSRGYSPRAAKAPTLVMTLHPAHALAAEQPVTWRLATASARVSESGMQEAHKTANKLLNILARMDAESKGADEALMLNEKGEVLEAASANVFWIQRETIFTPPLSFGVLPGITRQTVLELCDELSLQAEISTIKIDDLYSVAAIFLTQSVQGIIEVRALDNHAIPRHESVSRLYRAWRHRLYQ